MKIIDVSEQFAPPERAVVTMGTFDGVHLGHQTILKKIVEEAKATHGQSILITFWPHPRFVLNPNAPLKLLSTFEEKAQFVADLGVDYLMKVAFTPAFSSLSAEAFVRKILIEKANTQKLLIGYDHHFGNNREGNIDFLLANAHKFGFEVEEIPRQDIDHIGISSTKIRNALLEGDVSFARSLLGRNYTLRGRVIHGAKNGRKLGFPTANIEVPESFKLLPADGAYAVRVYHHLSIFDGMLNVGFKPTLDGQHRTIEAHLFNFEGDLYGESLQIEFIKMLRSEIKFHSLDQLRQQLKADQIQAQHILS